MASRITIEEHGELFIVYFTTPRDDQDFSDYLHDLDRRLATLQQFCFILIFDPHTNVTASQRKQQAQWIGDNFALLQARCWGAAFVIPNTVTRLFVAGIMLLQRLPYPYKAVRTIEEAHAWLDQQRRTRASTSAPP